LVSVTAAASFADPVATVFASRRAADRYFCWQEPASDLAIATLGSVREVVSRGPERVGDLIADTTAFVAGRESEEPVEIPVGVGPLWVGGLAFDPDGGRSPQWSSLPPALLVLPELLLARIGGRSWLTICAVAGGEVDPGAVRSAAGARLASLRQLPLPPLDPNPTAAVAVAGATQPADYERAVAAAVAEIEAGRFEKLVIAREVIVEGPSAHSVSASFGALRELFETCYCFCVGTPEAAFVGASPELLVRRDGGGAVTVALAGSARRSADPAIDDHLGEQLLRHPKDREEHAIVARRIERRLAPHSVWVEVAPDPIVIKVANIQHLATPIRAQLTEPRSALELVGLLHPTPAVGCEPDGPAGMAAIAALERIDRGWYAGAVGWMDMAEDGEFCVALRSGLLRDRRAHLFAGAGIVGDSEPAAELAETEVKLSAMLPLLAG
jgi:salicylate biosynthesis isochorismate synthase/menaquinone-specific isochorismate synthase